jgi:hypothetical protein
MRGVIKGPPDVYWGYYQKRQAWYFGQAGKAGVTLSISNYIWALRLNSGGGQLLQPADLERFFPTRSQAVFLRRVQFDGCILVRRPAIVTLLSCGIEQHDAAAVHF